MPTATALHKNQTLCNFRTSGKSCYDITAPVAAEPRCTAPAADLEPSLKAKTIAAALNVNLISAKACRMPHVVLDEVSPSQSTIQRAEQTRIQIILRRLMTVPSANTETYTMTSESRRQFDDMVGRSPICQKTNVDFASEQANEAVLAMFRELGGPEELVNHPHFRDDSIQESKIKQNLWIRWIHEEQHRRLKIDETSASDALQLQDSATVETS